MMQKMPSCMLIEENITKCAGEKVECMVIELLLCLLVVCLTTLSVIHNTCVMEIGWLTVNNEMEVMWRRRYALCHNL
jgi:hypothetical protein